MTYAAVFDNEVYVRTVPIPAPLPQFSSDGGGAEHGNDHSVRPAHERLVDRFMQQPGFASLGAHAILEYMLRFLLTPNSISRINSGFNPLADVDINLHRLTLTPKAPKPSIERFCQGPMPALAAPDTSIPAHTRATRGRFAQHDTIGVGDTMSVQNVSTRQLHKMESSAMVPRPYPPRTSKKRPRSGDSSSAVEEQSAYPSSADGFDDDDVRDPSFIPPRMKKARHSSMASAGPDLSSGSSCLSTASELEDPSADTPDSPPLPVLDIAVPSNQGLTSLMLGKPTEAGICNHHLFDTQGAPESSNTSNKIYPTERHLSPDLGNAYFPACEGPNTTVGPKNNIRTPSFLAIDTQSSLPHDGSTKLNKKLTQLLSRAKRPKRSC